MALFVCLVLKYIQFFSAIRTFVAWRIVNMSICGAVLKKLLEIPSDKKVCTIFSVWPVVFIGSASWQCVKVMLSIYAEMRFQTVSPPAVLSVNNAPFPPITSFPADLKKINVEHIGDVYLIFTHSWLLVDNAQFIGSCLLLLGYDHDKACLL